MSSQGKTCQGKAWLVKERHDKARHGMSRQGKACVNARHVMQGKACVEARNAMQGMACQGKSCECKARCVRQDMSRKGKEC
jgi:hypothetical protein